jgi:hypothetical protein
MQRSALVPGAGREGVGEANDLMYSAFFLRIQAFGPA